jgi:hypothetical protein
LPHPSWDTHLLLSLVSTSLVVPIIVLPLISLLALLSTVYPGFLLLLQFIRVADHAALLLTTPKKRVES